MVFASRLAGVGRGREPLGHGQMVMEILMLILQIVAGIVIGNLSTAFLIILFYSIYRGKEGG